MTQFVLMHKDVECGVLIIDETTGKVSGYKDLDKAYTPFLGNSTIENIKTWWEMRAIPANRETIKELIHSLTVISPEQYLAKNLGLSVTDTYWIRPIDLDISYDNINFFNLKVFNDGRIPYHNNTSYDPNASLGGQMEKYWDLSGDTPILIKKSYRYFGQQSINEVIATKLHSMQGSPFAYVNYQCEKTDDGGTQCRCPAFTSTKVELVNAYEVVSSKKISKDTSYYKAFIEICSERGVDKQYIQDYMDYQTITDFIISNTDEHLMNFGVIRDADTMSIIGPAPIFDSGNSMFYSDVKSEPFTRVEMLERKITSFYSSEEKMLKNVKNRNIVKIDLLPTPQELKDIYMEYDMPEPRVNNIISNYTLKCSMLKEFQQGIGISLYHEKRKSRAEKYGG